MEGETYLSVAGACNWLAKHVDPNKHWQMWLSDTRRERTRHNPIPFKRLPTNQVLYSLSDLQRFKDDVAAGRFVLRKTWMDGKRYAA